MPDYNSINCPICDNRFANDDDIVVCPQCGAPHHRQCWIEHGRCQFDELHADGFVWKRPDVNFEEEKNSESSDSQQSQSRPMACASCGTVNEAGRFFCKKCGAFLSREGSEQNNFDKNDNSDQGLGGFFRENQKGGTDPYAIFTDPLGGVAPDEDFNGVPAQKLADFMGSRSNYFMRVFKLFKIKRSKVFFNPYAFLFSGFWFLSKKMYGLGAVVTAAMLALRSGVALLQIYFTQPIYEQIKDLTAAEQIKYMSTLSPVQLLLGAILPYVLLFSVYAVMFLCGFFANVLYKKHCEKAIKTASATEFGIQGVIEKKGGTNMMCAISVAICFYLLMFFIQNIQGL